MQTHIKAIILVSLLVFSLASISEIEEINKENDNVHISQTITLNPNSPYDISNPLIFTVTISCTVKTIDDTDKVHGDVKKGTIYFNGEKVDQFKTIDVKNADKLTIKASGLASGTLTNWGQNTVTAECTLTQEETEESKNAFFDLETEPLFIDQDIQLAPNSPYELDNPLLWKVTVSCDVTTTDAEDTVEATVTKGSATVNGQAVEGTMSFTVKTGDKLTITASSLAKSSLTNKGQNPVNAHCSLTQESLEEMVYIQNVINKAFERVNTDVYYENAFDNQVSMNEENNDHEEDGFYQQENNDFMIQSETTEDELTYLPLDNFLGYHP